MRGEPESVPSDPLDADGHQFGFATRCGPWGIARTLGCGSLFGHGVVFGLQIVALQIKKHS